MKATFAESGNFGPTIGDLANSLFGRRLEGSIGTSSSSDFELGPWPAGRPDGGGLNSAREPDEWRIYSTDQASKKAYLRELAINTPNGSSGETGVFGHNYFLPTASPFLKEISSFLALGENWDGEGAKKIPEKAIFQSMNFLNEVLGSNFFQSAYKCCSKSGRRSAYLLGNWGGVSGDKF